MRITSKKQETRKRYFDFLIDLKKQLDLGNVISITSLIRQHKLSNTASQVLFKLQIVHKTNRRSRYVWNEKIPVTQRLANTFLEKTNEINMTCTKKSLAKKRIETPLEIKKQDPIKRKYKTRAITVKSNPITKSAKVNNTTQLTPNKVGLIRRFLRWIY